MRISVLKETSEGERRVALVPDSVKRLVAKKIEVTIERGAGVGACFSDAEYQSAGAAIAADARAAVEGASAVLKVQPPTPEELALLPRGTTLISLMFPLARGEAIEAAATTSSPAASPPANRALLTSASPLRRPGRGRVARLARHAPCLGPASHLRGSSLV